MPSDCHLTCSTDSRWTLVAMTRGFRVVDLARKTGKLKTGLKRQDYFATIPSLPISYDTAREIFQVLAGPNVPAGWQGGLPLAYHVGARPGGAGVFDHDGLQAAADLERDRHDSRIGRA